MPINVLQKPTYALILLLPIQFAYGLDSIHQEQNFEKLLSYFEDLPDKVSNQYLHRISETGKNVTSFFHANNYQKFAHRIVPIGKIKISKNYVLVVGNVDKDVSSDKSVMYVGAFLMTNNGELKDTEKYLTKTGELAFQKQRFIGNIKKQGSTYHFYDAEIDIPTGEQRSTTKVYKMTSNKISYQKTLP